MSQAGNFFEDFAPGQVIRHALGRTVTDADNIWFTGITHNPNQVHFNAVQSERGLYGRPLVNSTFTLALITGMTVPDTSENAAANLGWADIMLPNPVFEGDTLWAESEILESRAVEIAGVFDGSVTLAELGSGSAVKTRLLIEAFLACCADPT